MLKHLVLFLNQKCFCLLFKHESVDVQKLCSFPSFLTGLFIEKVVFSLFVVTTSTREIVHHILVKIVLYFPNGSQIIVLPLSRNIFQSFSKLKSVTSTFLTLFLSFASVYIQQSVQKLTTFTNIRLLSKVFFADLKRNVFYDHNVQVYFKIPCIIFGVILDKGKIIGWFG